MWPSFTAQVDRQGTHKKIKSGNFRYKRENQNIIRNTLKNRYLHLTIAIYKENHVFAYHATLKPKNGTKYVDFAVKFPIRSIEGNTAIFMLYDWL